MASAQEFPQAAPPGVYTSRIVEAEGTVSKKGDSMLRLTVEIVSPPQYAGQQASDYLGTDGTSKFGAMSKGRLRGLLGEAAVSTDAETPDAIIAQQLLNRLVDVEYGNEPWMSESVKGSGNYDTTVTSVDPKTGQTIIRQKLIVKNYRPATGVAQQLSPLGQAPAPQQFQQQAPQGYAPQGQQLAPQGAPQMQFQQPQAQQLPPQAQQYAQPPFQQQLAPQGQAPQGFAVQAPQQFQPQYPPQNLAPQGAPQGFAPPQGQAPWQAPVNGQAPGQAQAPAEAPKKGRRVAVQDQTSDGQ